MDPADFYTGLVAELYSNLRSTDPDPEPYARFIARTGTPALELGCGDGDPLLELRARGLDVEGLDSSADMLERCRARAASLGLEVALHHSAIESMDLPGRYRSIFIAGPTFNLIVDDTTAGRALHRIAAHLTPDGAALIPLFVPPVVRPAQLGRAVEHTTDDGTVLRCTTVSASRDEAARRQSCVLRYERIDARATTTLDREWILHWHTRPDFTDMATAAGLQVSAVLGPDGRATTDDADQFVFIVARV